ncbi:hypothetical protein MPER_15526, partial [Moniliophthora perniciosa FA553]
TSTFPHPSLIVARPLWPFMVAGSITIFYIGKIQDMAVRSQIAAESSAH